MSEFVRRARAHLLPVRDAYRPAPRGGPDRIPALLPLPDRAEPTVGIPVQPQDRGFDSGRPAKAG